MVSTGTEHWWRLFPSHLFTRNLHESVADHAQKSASFWRSNSILARESFYGENIFFHSFLYSFLFWIQISAISTDVTVTRSHARSCVWCQADRDNLNATIPLNEPITARSQIFVACFIENMSFIRRIFTKVCIFEIQGVKTQLTQSSGAEK